MSCENIKIEIGKSYITSINIPSIIKKICYIISNYEQKNKYNIIFDFGDVISRSFIEEKSCSALKKMFSILIYLIQIDVINNVTISINKLENDIELQNILNLIQFSGITNRFTIIGEFDQCFLSFFEKKYPHLNISDTYNKNEKIDHRYVLDKKQEFLYIKSL